MQLVAGLPKILKELGNCAHGTGRGWCTCRCPQVGGLSKVSPQPPHAQRKEFYFPQACNMLKLLIIIIIKNS